VEHPDSEVRRTGAPITHHPSPSTTQPAKTPTVG